MLPTRRLQPGHLQAAQDAVEQRDHLGVEQRVVAADRLGPELPVLAVAARLGRLVAEHRREVPELHRQRQLVHAVLDEGADHRRRALRAQRQGAAAAVLEGVHLLAHDVGAGADAAHEDLGLLEGRRHDLAVPVAREGVAGRVDHPLAHPGLRGQHVARARAAPTRAAPASLTGSTAGPPAAPPTCASGAGSGSGRGSIPSGSISPKARTVITQRRPPGPRPRCRSGTGRRSAATIPARSATPLNEGGAGSPWRRLGAVLRRRLARGLERRAPGVVDRRRAGALAALALGHGASLGAAPAEAGDPELEDLARPHPPDAQRRGARPAQGRARHQADELGLAALDAQRRRRRRAPPRSPRPAAPARWSSRFIDTCAMPASGR